MDGLDVLLRKEGTALGLSERVAVGKLLGDSDGLADASVDGSDEELPEGTELNSILGPDDGEYVGSSDGNELGVVVRELGPYDGELLGREEGVPLGPFDGGVDGLDVLLRKSPTVLISPPSPITMELMVSSYVS